jgi:predicted CoA-binding protein
MSTKSEFFSAERFALIGDTRERAFPKLTRRYLEEKGKTVYPVDLGGATEGAVATVAELPGDVEAAIIEVPKERTAGVVEDVVAQGVPRVWIHQMTETPEAQDLCRERGVPLETGGCAVMYLAPTASPHALHRGIWKLIGRY